MPQIQYGLQDIAFEWDNQKAITNFRKHTVKFELAAEAFFDPYYFRSYGDKSRKRNI